MTTERPTPLTDAEIVKGSEKNVTVSADFARQLERMCAELAEALKEANCPLQENCGFCEAIRKSALTNYNNLMKGVKHDNG